AKMFASNRDPGDRSACCTQSMVHAWKRGSNGSCAMWPSFAASGQVSTIAATSPSAHAIAVSRATWRNVTIVTGRVSTAGSATSVTLERRCGRSFAHDDGLVFAGGDDTEGRVRVVDRRREELVERVVVVGGVEVERHERLHPRDPRERERVVECAV